MRIANTEGQIDVYQLGTSTRQPIVDRKSIFHTRGGVDSALGLRKMAVKGRCVKTFRVSAPLFSYCWQNIVRELDSRARVGRKLLGPRVHLYNIF